MRVLNVGVRCYECLWGLLIDRRPQSPCQLLPGGQARVWTPWLRHPWGEVVLGSKGARQLKGLGFGHSKFLLEEV